MMSILSSLCFIIDCFHDRQFCLDCIVRSHSRKPKCFIIYTLSIRPLPMFCLCRASIRKQRAWHLTPPHPELSCQGGFLSRKHWGYMTSVFWYLNISKSCARDQTHRKIVGRCLQVLLKCFYTNIFMEYEMRAADFNSKYSELRTSRCHGDASLHHKHREDEDQKVTETVLMRCGPRC